MVIKTEHFNSFDKTTLGLIQNLFINQSKAAKGTNETESKSLKKKFKCLQKLKNEKILFIFSFSRDEYPKGNKKEKKKQKK